MTFDVQDPFEHDGKEYEPGDEFDKLKEKEAIKAGLVPDVLKPNPGGSSSSGSSKNDGSEKGDE